MRACMCNVCKYVYVQHVYARTCVCPNLVVKGMGAKGGGIFAWESYELGVCLKRFRGAEGMKRKNDSTNHRGRKREEIGKNNKESPMY